MHEMFKNGNTVLASQPFSRMLGANLLEFQAGVAKLELMIKDEHKQQHGSVHGGVLSYLADNCLTFCGGSVLGDCVTSEYKINYLKPALGDNIVAHAKLVSSEKCQAVCECRVYSYQNDKKEMVAAAQGTIVKVNG